MRKFIANLICDFIPSKMARRKVRGIIRRGVIRYIKLSCLKEPDIKFDNFLSAVAIMKNEGLYIQEWIEYHRLVGIEKFYIYDNESADDTRKILEPYIKAGIVEYKFWPGDKMQHPAYNDVIRVCEYKTKWLAIIDADEFIVPLQDKSIPDILRAMPRGARQLLIKWNTYGSSGHIKRPEGLVIENYKYRRADNDNQHLKPILSPRFTLLVQSCHFGTVAGASVDENGKRVRSLSTDVVLPHRKIRINHYQCKSWEDSQNKHKRGDALHGKDYNGYTKEIFDALDKNEVFDPIMDKYIEPVKQAIAKI